MVGRKGNLLPGDTVTLSPSLAIIEYLKLAVATGLYGKTVPDAAERLVAEGLRRLIDEGKIQLKSFPLVDGDSE